MSRGKMGFRWGLWGRDVEGIWSLVHAMPPFAKQKAPAIPRIPGVTGCWSCKALDSFMAAEQRDGALKHTTQASTHQTLGPNLTANSHLARIY